MTTPAVRRSGAVNFTVRRSKGYEGMAASPDGNDSIRRSKARSGMPEEGLGKRPRTEKQYLRILEF